MIRILLSFFLVSFSFGSFASSQLYEVTDTYRVYVDSSSCSLSKGMVITKSHCIGSTWTYRGEEFKVSGVSLDKYNKFQFVDSEKGKIGYYGIVKAVSSCPSGTVLNPDSGKCEDIPVGCPASQGKDAPFPQGPVPDDGQSLGSSRLSCDTSNHCEVLSGYRASNGSMIKDSFYTGEDCVGNENDYSNCPYYGSCDGKTPPEPDALEDPWDGCTKPYVDSAFVCREDTDGDGKPNTDAPYDDKAICEHDSSGKFSCVLGSYDDREPVDPIAPTEPDGDVSHGGNIPDASGDPATIQPVEPPKDVTEPDLTPDSNGDVVKAVTSMNRDVNQALNDLNIDINQSQASINTELDRLNKNVVNNSNATRDLAQTNIDIYNNTKQLIQGVEIAVKTGTASTVEAINTNGENTVNAINTGFSDVGDSLEEIKGSLDDIANVDTSSAGTSGSCIETDTCTGFYTSKYPEGFKGVASEYFESIKSEVLDGFVDSFMQVDLSNSSQPDWTLNFDLGFIDLGRHSFSDYFQIEWIFSFVRVCMMFGAVMLSRKLVFGG